MDRRFAAPGSEVADLVDVPEALREGVPVPEVDGGRVWDQYLALPSANRIGIACSGGGIRSASYCLGALQVLRRQRVLGAAAHLACVSGGGYISIAHTILVSEALRRGRQQGAQTSEARLFGDLPPWAPLSPEERHLRDHSTYLAPSLDGKLWFLLNIVYGLLRHLVPFAAGLYLCGAVAGIALGRWLGPALRDQRHEAVEVDSMMPLIYGLVVVAAIALIWRQFIQTGPSPDGATMTALQLFVVFVFKLQLVIFMLLVGLPALMLFLATHPFDWIGGSTLQTTGATTGSAVGLSLVASTLMRGELQGLRRRVVRLLMPLLISVVGPLSLLIPFIGVAYWNALRGGDFSGRPFAFLIAAAALLVFSWFFNEATPNMHLFYRERLATAFVGFRRLVGSGPKASFRFEQAPWKDPILFSESESGTAAASLPNLVVCAAVNVSGGDVPPGRLAASFTFERDRCGGPLTGYVPTSELEQGAGGTGVTLPALIAISGAAVSPSMGKMTRPGLRMLMALFNVRLGVWLPNPRKASLVRSAAALRLEGGFATPAPPTHSASPSLAARVKERARKPGTSYTFREVVGLNDLKAPYVYVTDGGHWENLGLVELLRRGCGQIVCFDAAGDDLGRFWTLSEAIGLARTELGVEIDIDLEALEPDDAGVSRDAAVSGTIRYPGGTTGVLVFAKAAMAEDAPQDAKAYRERNRRFPADPTSDQLFNDSKFESYRALGAHAAREAVQRLADWRDSNGLPRLP